MGLSERWITQLGLTRHPEGGWYRETYRSTDTVRLDRGARAVSTAIYYLLEAGDFSALHRIRSDEMWHHYAGDPLQVVSIEPDGGRRDVLLGAVPGAVPQAVIPQGAWFGSRVAEAGRFALVGCTVAPGFEFEDFEMAERAALIAEFPQHQAIIEALTRTLSSPPYP